MRGFLYGFLGVLIVALLMFEAAASAVRDGARAHAAYHKHVNTVFE